MASKNLLKILRESDKNLAEAGMDMLSNATKDTVKTISGSLKSELEEEWRTSMRQILGLEKQSEGSKDKIEGDLKEGEEISFAKAKKEKISRAEGHIDYRSEIIHAETRKVHAENRELKQKLVEIQIELKKITDSSKELEATFKDVSVATLNANVKPGKYHVNFYEWILTQISNARVRIENAGSWINAIAGKKSKKDFWSLAKTQGTSFSLSGERAVAQQTG